MLISFTATASRGYTYDEAEEMLSLFSDVLAGRAGPKTLGRMLEITSAAVPITASMRKTMRRVRADEQNDLWRDFGGEPNEAGGSLRIAPGPTSPARREGEKTLKRLYREGS